MPVESLESGARETVLAGPYHILQMCRDRDAEDVDREETWGVVSPHHPSRGLGERRKLPQRGSARPKMDFMHIQGQKEATWETIFSIFEQWRGPQNVARPGKIFILPPLDGPDFGRQGARPEGPISKTKGQRAWVMRFL